MNDPGRPQHAGIPAVLAIGVVIFVMALLVLLGPVAYDTGQFGDTLFILGAAWRQSLGLVPTIDFGHFYGGFTSWVIARAIALTGPDVRAFDYALLMIFTGFGLAAATIAWRRMSGLGTAIVLLVIAALIFTRHPLESGQSLTRLFSTHSFLYNRIGLAIVVMAGLFATLRSPLGRAEVLGGAVTGGLLVVALLTKPTFVILVPAVLLALILQARWWAVLAMLVCFLIILMITDPWGARWMASFAYGQASVGDRTDAQLLPLIRKSVQVPLAQPVALTLVLAGLGALLLRPPRPWRPVLGGCLVAGAALGMTATMGGGGALGQLALPILAMLAVAAAELASRQGRMSASAWWIGAMALAAGFALPHAVNLFGTTVEGWTRRGEIVIEGGPLGDYLSVVEDGPPGTATQYQMLADGIAALGQLGDVSEQGIIADNGISFEFALLAPPVPGYPLWPRATAPELAPGLPLPTGTDIVLLGRAAQEDRSIGPILRSKMVGDFSFCLTTRYWDIFVRDGASIQGCTRSPASAAGSSGRVQVGNDQTQ